MHAQNPQGGGAPGKTRRVGGHELPPRRDGDHRATDPLLDRSLELGRAGFEALHMGRHHGHAGSRGVGGDRLDARNVGSHRLLDQHRNARRRGQPGVVHMDVLGARDDHRAEVGPRQHGGGVVERRRAECAGHRLGRAPDRCRRRRRAGSRGARPRSWRARPRSRRSRSGRHAAGRSSPRPLSRLQHGLHGRVAVLRMRGRHLRPHEPAPAGLAHDLAVLRHEAAAHEGHDGQAGHRPCLRRG